MWIVGANDVNLISCEKCVRAWSQGNFRISLSKKVILELSEKAGQVRFLELWPAWFKIIGKLEFVWFKI